MRIKLFISIFLLLTAIAVTAQTNNYPGTTGTITRIGYTYKYRARLIANVVTDRHELYNAANPYLNTEWGYIDGSPMPFAEKMGNSNVELISDSSQTIAQTLEMVNGLFSQQQKTMLQGHSVFIDLQINSSTGTISDVYFSFFQDSPFVYIPVETFRSIELALKQNLSVTVTPEGWKLTYIQLFWNQKF